MDIKNISSKKHIIISLSLIILLLFIIIYFFTKKNINRTNNNLDIYEEINNGSNSEYSYSNPVIPQGFKKVETDTASWELDEQGNPKGWNDGLVIEDELGNQFVWVPYDNSYQVEINNLKDYIIEELKLKKQILVYGGFYIARYEAGISYDTLDLQLGISEKTNDIQGVPVSKKDAIPWNYISKENANNNARLMYKNNEYVDGNLIIIKQRNIIDKWLEKTGHDYTNLKLYGNYSNSLFYFYGLYSDNLGKSYYEKSNTKKRDKNIILSTGANENFKVNNVYDYFGNVAESTKSLGEDNGFICYASGGYYDNSDKTEVYTHAWANSKTGFRVWLIIKN